MRTLTYRDNSPGFLGPITLVSLFVFSLSLHLADHCLGQAQQPAAEGAPAAEPAAEPAEKPAAEPDAKLAAEPAETKPVAETGEYDELPCKEDLRKEQRSDINRLLKEQTLSAADLTLVETYFKDYGLARWTVKAHEHEVRQFRQELSSNFRRIRSPRTYDQINTLALRMLGDMAKGNYSPVARINAMLAIGGLNLREPARTTDKAVPLSQALPVMLQAYGDPDQIDGVRLAALLGILRHVSLGITDAQVRDTQVLPVILALAKANQPPEGRSDEGHAWFRVRAVDTLGALTATGEQGEVANTLGDIAGDETSPLSVRCAAARSLGQLNYTDPAGMASGDLIAKLTELATAICSQEAATLDKQKKDEVPAGRRVQGPSARSRSRGGGGLGGRGGGLSLGGRGGGLGGGGGGMSLGGRGRDDDNDRGRMMNQRRGNAIRPPMGAQPKKVEEDTPQTRRITASRRRLKARMLSVLMGLGADVKQDDSSRAGIHVLVTDPDQETQLRKLTVVIKTLVAKLDDKEGLDSDALDEAIAKASDDFGQVLADPVAAPEEEQPPAENTAAAAPVAQ